MLKYCYFYAYDLAAQVRGAGHEVPMFKPVEALQLFKDFLKRPHTGLGGGMVGPNLMLDDDDDDDKSTKNNNDDDENGTSSNDSTPSDESNSNCAEATPSTSTAVQAGVAGIFAGFIAGVMICLAWFACCLPGRRRQLEEVPNKKASVRNGRSSSWSGEGLEMGGTTGEGNSYRNSDGSISIGDSDSGSGSPVRQQKTKAGGFMRVDVSERESEHDQVNPLVHAAAARYENDNALGARSNREQAPDGYSSDVSSGDSARTFSEAPEGTLGNDGRVFV